MPLGVFRSRISRAKHTGVIASHTAVSSTSTCAWQRLWIRTYT